MTTGSGATSWYDEISIFALWNLAVAQQLFDLLSRNAEFFVFQGTTPFELLSLTAAVSIILPAVIVFVLQLLKRIDLRLSRIVRIVIMTILIGCLVLPGLRAHLDLNGYLVLAVVTMMSFGVAAGYFRFNWLRSFFLFLAPAILVVPIIFVTNVNIKKILNSQEEALPKIAIGSPVPIVFIIYDELPVTSLMNEEGNIDERWFPNFAQFASESNWYRNATTVASKTSYAVPAILTGRIPEPGQLPIVLDHQRSLFTILSETYDFKVMESWTKLCPRKKVASYELSGRLNAFVRDLGSIYLHIVLPEDLTFWLPPVTNAWGDFSGQGRVSTGRKRLLQFDLFLDSIKLTDQPTLYFLHSHLPHSPWQYMPSGKEYSSSSHDKFFVRYERWPFDSSAAITAYQRHLLQVAHTDNNLGRLVSKLKQIGLYDQALIVLTADHGISFQPNEYRRVISNANYPEIISVPLFIKLPGVNAGRMYDWNVETIDILPTIVEVLEISLPWELDGVSVLNRPPDRKRKTAWNLHRVKQMNFEPVIEKKFDIVKRKLALFGPAIPVSYSTPNHVTSWTDISVADLNAISKELSVRVDLEEDYQNVNLTGDYLPLFVTGNIYFKDTPTKPVLIGIAVNGKIRTVIESFKVSSDRHSFGGMIPEESLKNGSNKIQIVHFNDQNEASLIPFAEK